MLDSAASSDNLPFVITDATRTAFPALTHVAEQVAGLRRSPSFYARRLAKTPVDIRDYRDYAYAPAPRAKDLKQGRATLTREMAALESCPAALAELQAAYAGEVVA